MANIVELRQMDENALREKLENAREEMFNLRFQNASARLSNPARIREVRRDMAQIRTVLHQRELAVEEATQQPDIAAALGDNEWEATTQFKYEESAWVVTFADANGGELATANVDLNQKRPKTRRERAG